MAMTNASLDRNLPSSRAAASLPYTRHSAAPPPSAVPYDIPAESPEPTIKKKRKRADARQLEALNRMYNRTAFPSTEERLQLARELDMSPRSVQIWLAHIFVYTTCIIPELSTIL
jgi:homeobox protein YOX1/YHP1